MEKTKQTIQLYSKVSISKPSQGSIRQHWRKVMLHGEVSGILSVWQYLMQAHTGVFHAKNIQLSLSIIKFSYKISKQSKKQCESSPLLGHRRMSKNVGSDCQGSS